ncbi:NAD(P)-linked oxidoreductase superfamily protein [Trema orientale]|uniref:NAD(P)-linked oxidoreductase superfamily protein n=1 Tax=Trema orientale TaxID=63057 RepID=A0A2P5FQC6_TREOI|nr:NAD(P)-linked oxidoreductase superfamily protein [Trema orientale]
MVPGTILFPKLKEIFFERAQSLREWDGVPGWTVNCPLKIMPRLQSLTLRDCSSLESLPDFLESTPLEYLSISGSQAMCESCKKETGRDWPKIRHVPNIYVTMFQAERARFDAVLRKKKAHMGDGHEATIYLNEPEVGEALAEAFRTGLALRERGGFITAKAGVGTIIGVLDEDNLLDIDTIPMEDLVSMGLVRGIGIRNSVKIHGICVTANTPLEGAEANTEMFGSVSCLDDQVLNVR